MGLMLSLVLAASTAAPWVLVVHKDSEVQSVTKQDLARVMFGKLKELNGRRVMVAMQTSVEFRNKLVAAAAGQSLGATEETFITQELRGEGRRPALVVDSTELLRRVVESQSIQGRPAVLGCMTLEAWKTLTDAQRALLRVVPIDGKTADSDEYVLRVD